MQHVKNAIGGNAMKLLKMHQTAFKCLRMRMLKNNTTFVKKQQLIPRRPGRRARRTRGPGPWPSRRRGIILIGRLPADVEGAHTHRLKPAVMRHQIHRARRGRRVRPPCSPMAVSAQWRPCYWWLMTL